MRERRIVAALIPDAVDPSGGLFVSLADDPGDYAGGFKDACGRAGIPVSELDPAQVMAEEPSLSRSVRRAFSVPDATINPWRLVNSLAGDIRSRGGKILSRHRVTSIRRTTLGAIEVGVAAATGARTLTSQVLVNASGPWSAQIAALADQSVELELTKGSIIVLSHRVVRRVINRCRYPTSHDIMVPTGTVSLFGTTSEVVRDPSITHVRPAEIQELLDGAAPLIPHIRDMAVLRAWAGVRPLVKPANWPSGMPVPRRHKVIDHAASGLPGMFTVCGGSLTTHRSMAEDVSNQVCAWLGWNVPCQTAAVPLVPAGREYWSPLAGFAASEAAPSRPVTLCECESVTLAAAERMVADGITNLHDLRRRLRVGFGPCQGTFCGPRMAEVQARARVAADPSRELDDFWNERIKGMVLAGWGKQARQILLSEHVHRRMLGLGQAASPPPVPRT
jgi:glycerol-3-phosphate dehydrogenase